MKLKLVLLFTRSFQQAVSQTSLPLRDCCDDFCFSKTIQLCFRFTGVLRLKSSKRIQKEIGLVLSQTITKARLGTAWQHPVTLLIFLSFRNYMNDSLRTDVFVRFQPESIACACIYLAARTLEVSRLLVFRSTSSGYFI